jgi:transposase InsO family protein
MFQGLLWMIAAAVSCADTSFDRRVRRVGIAQARTPFRSPRANAIAERWVRSVRTECLDHVFIFNERHLQKVLAEYVGLYEHPACQVPPAPFFYLSFFPVPFSCSTAPQAFSRPDRIVAGAGARRCCQGWPLFSGHPPGGLGLYSNRARRQA